MEAATIAPKPSTAPNQPIEPLAIVGSNNSERDKELFRSKVPTLDPAAPARPQSFYTAVQIENLKSDNKSIYNF